MKPLSALAVVLAVVLVIFCTPLQSADVAFEKWWPAFQAAVARRDAQAVGQGMRFPQPWENGPKVREITTQRDLAERFDRFFTPAIKKQIATQKPKALASGGYIVVWHARGNEYSLNFVPHGGGFALDGLGEGPP